MVIQWIITGLTPQRNVEHVITIAETPHYFAKSKKLLKPEEQAALVDYLSEHPKAGDLMQEMGGIRKLR